MNSKNKKEILRLLSQTIVTPEMLKDFLTQPTKSIDALIPLQNYIKHHVPDSLYRIRRPTERNLTALEKDEIHAARATNFNDPYDCLLYFDENELCNEIMDDISNDALTEYLNSKIINSDDNEQRIKIDLILKYAEEFRPKLIEQVKNQFPKITNMLQAGTYISCFTEYIDSPIMWSHYGENHKGFAVRYNFSEEFFSPQFFHVSDVDYPWYGWRSILPVIYSEKRFDSSQLANWFSLCEFWKSFSEDDTTYNDLNIYQTDMLLKTKMCLNKAKEWKYENEWRLIITHEWPNDPGNYYMHIEYSPTAIYLGARMEDEYKEKLVRIAIDKNIPIFEMYVDNKNRAYKMSIKEYSLFDEQSNIII